VKRLALLPLQAAALVAMVALGAVLVTAYAIMIYRE
jgi:hypothetical protein